MDSEFFFGVYVCRLFFLLEEKVADFFSSLRFFQGVAESLIFIRILFGVGGGATLGHPVRKLADSENLARFFSNRVFQSRSPATPNRIRTDSGKLADSENLARFISNRVLQSRAESAGFARYLGG